MVEIVRWEGTGLSWELGSAPRVAAGHCLPLHMSRPGVRTYIWFTKLRKEEEQEEERHWKPFYA